MIASLVFSLGLVNTIYQRIRNPIFRGTFSLLISDPISNKISDIENNFASALTNQQTIDTSTLVCTFTRAYHSFFIDIH